MKKFILMILCTAAFFVGLGGLAKSVGARFRSDERALELLRQAREAVGGEAKINAVKSLTIKGTAAKTFDFGEEARTEQGEWELNMQLPGQLSKKMMLRHEDGTGGKTTAVNKQVDVVIVKKGEDGSIPAIPDLPPGEKKVFVIKKDGDNATWESKDAPGNVMIKRDVRVAGPGEQNGNELFRTMLALFLTAPQGVDASYTYGGESSVDGVNCDIVNADAKGSVVKLFLDKSSHLPVMVTYQAVKPPVFKFKSTDGQPAEKGDVKVFTRSTTEPDKAEYQIKFSDYRNVNGLQMPFQWTQTVAGKADETITISDYDVNPVDIAEKFKEAQPTKVFVRTAKPQ